MNAAAMIWRQMLERTDRTRNAPLAVLDIGSSKLCCFIGRWRPGRGFVLLGRGYQGADGLRCGEVVDAEAAEASIQAVVNEAEQQARDTVREIWLSVSGGRPHSTMTQLSLPLGGRAVDGEDLRGLLDESRQDNGEVDRDVLHTVPVEMTIDGGPSLRDPRGMRGQRLDLRAHLVTVRSQPLKALLSCVERSHLEVAGVVSSTYAAGVACLSRDEAERGCLLLDMGGGATGVAHFWGGRLAFVDQVPYGGEHVTSDLAYGLDTSREQAERLKALYGGVVLRAGDANERIRVPLTGEAVDAPSGEVARARLTQITRARIDEIFQLVQHRLRSSWDMFQAKPPRTLVLTGGGSQLEGIEEFAQESFGLPVRIGRPDVVHGTRGVESETCCASASGAMALALGEDGGLGWRQTQELPFLQAGMGRLGQWWRQNFF